jgi:hypothetical protein
MTRTRDPEASKASKARASEASRRASARSGCKASRHETHDGCANEPTSLRTLLAKSHAAAAAAGGIAIDSETWREVVGDRIARHARPGRLSRGVLTVQVSSSVWAQELSLLSDELRARLRNGGVAVTSLRFAVTTGVTEADAQVSAAPPRHRPPQMRLPEPLKARLAAIDDPGLRRVIAEAASESLALRSRRSQASRAERPGARVPRSAARESVRPDRTRPDAHAGSRCTRADRQR